MSDPFTIGEKESFERHSKFASPKYIIFKDDQNGVFYTGKIGSIHSKGEEDHWPKLLHRSIAKLVRIINVNKDFNIYLTTYMKQTLKQLVHQYDFMHNSECFNWKKIYIEDILWGIDFLHRKSLCLLNISDENIFICPQENKAVLADFSTLTLIKKDAKYNFQVPFLHKAPELANKMSCVNPISAEIWSIGIMIMDIFLSHITPWIEVDFKANRALDVLLSVSYDALKSANYGSTLKDFDIDALKMFVGSFLQETPNERTSCRSAASSKFIQSARKSICAQYGNIFNKQRPSFIHAQQQRDDDFKINLLCESNSANPTQENKSKLLSSLVSTDPEESILFKMSPNTLMGKKEIVTFESNTNDSENNSNNSHYFAAKMSTSKSPDSYSHSRNKYSKRAHVMKSETKNKEFNVLQSDGVRLHSALPKDSKEVSLNYDIFLNFSPNVKPESLTTSYSSEDQSTSKCNSNNQHMIVRKNSESVTTENSRPIQSYLQKEFTNSDQSFTHCNLRKGSLFKSQNQRTLNYSFKERDNINKNSVLLESSWSNDLRTSNKRTVHSLEDILENHRVLNMKDKTIKVNRKQIFPGESSSFSAISDCSSIGNQNKSCEQILRSLSSLEMENIITQALSQPEVSLKAVSVLEVKSNPSKIKEIKSCRQTLEPHKHLNEKDMQAEDIGKQKFCLESSNTSEFSSSEKEQTQSRHQTLKNPSRFDKKNKRVKDACKQKFYHESSSTSEVSNDSVVRNQMHFSKQMLKNHCQLNKKNGVISTQCNRKPSAVSKINDDSSIEMQRKAHFIKGINPLLNKSANNEASIEDINNNESISDVDIMGETNADALNENLNYNAIYEENVRKNDDVHSLDNKTNHSRKKYSYEKAIAQNSISAEDISPANADQVFRKTVSESRLSCNCLECQWHRIKEERRSALKETDFKSCCRLTNKRKCQIAKFLLKTESVNRVRRMSESPTPNHSPSRIPELCSPMVIKTTKGITEFGKNVGKKPKAFTTPCFCFKKN